MSSPLHPPFAHANAWAQAIHHGTMIGRPDQRAV
jgi:hypothetical protein